MRAKRRLRPGQRPEALLPAAGPDPERLALRVEGMPDDAALRSHLESLERPAAAYPAGERAVGQHERRRRGGRHRLAPRRPAREPVGPRRPTDDDPRLKNRDIAHCRCSSLRVRFLALSIRERKGTMPPRDKTKCRLMSTVTCRLMRGASSRSGGTLSSWQARPRSWRVALSRRAS